MQSNHNVSSVNVEIMKERQMGQFMRRIQHSAQTQAWRQGRIAFSTGATWQTEQSGQWILSAVAEYASDDHVNACSSSPHMYNCCKMQYNIS